MKSINVYDFDGTIYDGDSSIDFFKFALKKDKKVCLKIPLIALAWLGYSLRIKKKEYFKSVFFSFVGLFSDLDSLVGAFWDNNEKKIKKFYLRQHDESDIIISASPDFLLAPLAKKMKFKLIATDVDKKTGKLLSKNCYGEEKVRRFKETGKQIEKFYSDSLSDTPLAEIAKNAFLVKGEVVIPWNSCISKK